MEIQFIKPKLSSTSTKEDILLAINQFISKRDEIHNLGMINRNNYSEFINEHRDIIKKNIPIVGKTYRFVKKDKNRISYEISEVFNKIEFFYVNYGKLQSSTHWGMIPQVKCIPLDIDGNPFEGGRYEEYLCISQHCKGTEIDIDLLSEEDYPEITKVFKKIISKKTEQDMKEYNRLKRKFGE
jgi:hypothetical protein